MRFKQETSTVKPHPPVVKHFILIALLLGLLYLISGVGLSLHYFTNRCSHASLAACEFANRSSCGTPFLETADDCEQFVKETENCYCSKCRLCLNAYERSHCLLSNEERIRMCQEQMSSI